MTKKSTIKARALLALMLVCGAAVLSAHGYEYIAEQSDALFFADETPLREDVCATEYVLGISYAPGAPGALENSLPIYEQNYAEISRYIPQPIFPPAYVAISDCYAAQLACFTYLTRNIFLADPRTRLLETDVCAAEFLAKDFAIDLSSGPQVLIVHAHSMEMFADSNPSDKFTGVLGVGRKLAEVLERDHGLQVYHHLGRFDVVAGIPNRQGSYERLEPAVRRILADNPSIQVVIDLHRDGVGPHVQPMVSYVNGERAAQIMFVNGLSRRYRNGVIQTVYHLPNPYQRENLAFSFNLQLAANQMFPGLARRIYLLEFRYSLHMAPRSILLEVGAQNNTLQEALNAVPHVAEILAAVVLA